MMQGKDAEFIKGVIDAIIQSVRGKLSDKDVVVRLYGLVLRCGGPQFAREDMHTALGTVATRKERRSFTLH